MMAGEIPLPDPSKPPKRRHFRIGPRTSMVMASAAVIATGVLVTFAGSDNGGKKPETSISSSWCGFDTLGNIHTYDKASVPSLGDIAQHQGSYFEDAISVAHPEKVIFSGPPQQVAIDTDSRHGTMRPVCVFQQTIKKGDQALTVLLPLSQIDRWNQGIIKNDITSISGTIAATNLRPDLDAFVVTGIHEAA